MKGSTLDSILSLAILILLVIIVIQQCNPKQAIIKPDSYNVIVEKIQSNFDTIETEVFGTIQGDISILDSVLNDRINILTSAQKELLQRVKQSEARLRKENKELKQFLSIKTATSDTITEKIYVVDTTGAEVIVPEWFRNLPWQLKATHVNDMDYVNVFYDLLSDSVTAEILIHNDFEIEQYEEAGESFVRVNNLNPKTYTLPGSSSFNLDLPVIQQPPKQIQAGFQFGIGVTSDLQPRPYIGLGLNYRPRIKRFKIFNRK